MKITLWWEMLMLSETDKITPVYIHCWTYIEKLGKLTVVSVLRSEIKNFIARYKKRKKKY